jgi:ectoine hydroxylase-related dioxygenase (phytanoyl-CoA dioxygenase family)
VIPGAHRHGTLAHEMTPLGWCCAASSSKAIPIPATAGDIVVFSSLTPHRTGPNLTRDVRKSYIVQYAPDGAVHRTDDEAPALQNDCERQYLVLRDGLSVNVD